jgi:Na+/melibiose symporter-like transporter
VNKKLTSGKFWLCIVAAICLLMLTATLCKTLWNSPDGDLGSGSAAVLAMLTTILTAIVTHYFTKRSNPDGE